MYVKDYIKMEDLKEGYLYRIIARNARYGIWKADEQSFIISRIKFGDNFLFPEYHYDCPAFATAQPLKEIEQSPFRPKDIRLVYEVVNNSVKEEEILEYLNKFEGDRDYLKPAWMKPKWTQKS